MIDLKQRMNDQIANAARQFYESQRAKPGASGRSPDGSVEVTLNGLGDVTDVRVGTAEVSEELATKLAQAFKLAWMAAGRELALGSTANNDLAQRTGLADMVEQEIDQRFGTPAEQEEQAPEQYEDPDDYGTESPLR